MVRFFYARNTLWATALCGSIIYQPDFSSQTVLSPRGFASGTMQKRLSYFQSSVDTSHSNLTILAGSRRGHDVS